MELASAFYRTAKSDLKVAKLLYDNGAYSHAVFHLQQAIEKVSKAYGLINGIIKPIEKDISRDISHNTKRIFTKQISKHQRELGKLETVEEIFPDLLRFEVEGEVVDITGYNKKFRKASQAIVHLKSEDFMWLCSDHIDEIIEQIEAASSPVDLNLQDLEIDFPVLVEGMISHFEKTTGRSMGDVKELLADSQLSKTLTPVVQEMVQNSIKIIKIYLTLFFFSLIFTGHNQHSRYPCFCCAEGPEIDYHDKEGLIVKFPDMWKLLNECFLLFEEVFVINASID